MSGSVGESVGESVNGSVTRWKLLVTSRRIHRYGRAMTKPSRVTHRILGRSIVESIVEWIVGVTILLTIGLAIMFAQLPKAFASGCDDRLTEEIQLDTKAQDQRYRDFGDGGIRPGNQSRFRSGTNGRAVLVLHGFLASPFEVESVATRLNQAGFTVLSPLVMGFGTSPKNANHIKMADYRENVHSNFNRLKECYSDVSLVGMSWGGGLANDFVLNDPLGAEVKSLILLSPYLKAKQWGAESINVWTSKYVDVLPSWVAGVTAPNDHRVFKLFPQYHTPGLPLLTEIESLKFCDSLPTIDSEKIASQKSIQSTVPTFLVTSDADETVDPKFAREYVSIHYPNLTVLTYEKSLNIPHQVPVTDVNPKLPALLEKIVNHLN